MKLYKFIIIGAIIVIALGILFGAIKSKEIIGKTPSKIENEQNDDSVEENYISNDETSNNGKELDFYSNKVQNLYFFTGAYPTNEVAYLSKLKNIKREDLTNEQILRLGFAKVTKEDWADSYTAEGEPVEIHASILEKNIEKIFGDIEYKHSNFSNKDISIDGAITTLYDNEYDEEMNKYIIDLVPGAGAGDSYSIDFKAKAIEYIGEKIEIVVKPIYIKNMGEVKGEDGSYEMLLQVFKSYDFETGEFSGKLTKNNIATNLYEMTYVDGEYKTDYIEEIKNINEEDLETYTITYKYLDGDYIFDSIKYEE